MFNPVDIGEYKDRQVAALLGVDYLPHPGKEIFPKDLALEFKRLYQDKSDYSHILFENRGVIELFDFKKQAVIPFEMVAISHYQTSLFHNYLQMKWIDDLGAVSIHEPNKGVIAVRKPSFGYFNNNVNVSRDPHQENKNKFKINFGRFLSRVELIVNADYAFGNQNDYLEILVEGGDSEREEQSAPTQRYKQPSAWGYKVVK